MYRILLTLVAVRLAVQAIDPEIIHVRAKRQPCRCVKDISLQNSLTCGCAAPVMIPGAPLAVAQYQQQLALATQLQYVQPVYTSCGCVPLMYLANPVYSCSCNGESPAPTTPPPATIPIITTTTTLPTPPPSTTTTVLPIIVTTTEATTTTTPTTTTSTTTTTTPTTTTTTTTTPSPTTTTTLATTTTLPNTTTILISVPETTTTTLAPTTSAPCVYPPVAVVNSTQQGCFCLDVPTQVVQPFCGCRCDCNSGLTSVPSGVCSCPQNIPVPVQMNPTYQQAPNQNEAVYPLTTTCVIQIGVPQASSCNCLPQYNNCAPNICCLKPAYRSYKKTHVDDSDRNAIDVMIDLLKKMKNVY